ncbi:family 16 glycoside hydrolase [Aquimarina sp. RZ0]|uniref:family 16 glycoside hydrolase n=1 Tax=Aquimarina sp. RZ0 TaxID=2607730 RepID=UPI0011F1AD68|nr:family 16 glycoside hydrolase [Aquimarina sp. RZ0]KAA1245580.1 hypothetical protein F0000_11565 [Aquimarina sp. RZ0]
MVRLIVWILLSIFCFQKINAQNSIPLDTLHWEINAQSYKLENYKGKDAIYIKQGLAFLKDTKFLNGTIEFDVYLTEQQGFPGIRFRATDRNNMESFYIRSHLSGKPDGNQVAPVINGSTPWQLYFGPKYSFIYNYNYDRWTHIKIVVNGQRAQVYLDNARTAHLSWKLIHEPKEGEIAIGGGGSAMYYANFKINKNEDQIIDFKPTERTAIEGLISEWEISDKFEEKRLEDLSIVNALIQSRKWGEKKIEVEEGTAANIARQVILRDVTPGNTVFAKITVDSDKDQIKLFEFGYSDRVVVILNNEAIYRGTNKWRSRDYRYLGTIGLFDAVYLNFKKGKNTLLLAVSEDFGGWLVTGRFPDLKEIKVE